MAKKLKSYDDCWEDNAIMLWKYDDNEEGHPEPNISIDVDMYNPLEHWKWQTRVSSGVAPDGGLRYKKGYLADVTFFKNKCQEFHGDVEVTLKWYQKRYEHLSPKFMNYFKKALDKEYNKIKERQTKRSEASWAKTVLTNPDLELD
jgi:hypothetical protein